MMFAFMLANKIMEPQGDMAMEKTNKCKEKMYFNAFSLSLAKALRSPEKGDGK